MGVSAIIGSLNKSKVIGAIKALKKYGISNYKAVKIKTFREQPMNMYETLTLALYRAEKAIEYGGDIGVGIEGGIFFSLGYPIEGQVAIVIDRNNYVGLGFSSLFPLPIHFRSLLKEKSLGHIMEYETGLRDIGSLYGAIGYLSNGAITRIILTYESVLMALLPFMKKEFYKKLLTVDELKKILKTLKEIPNKYV